MSSLGAAQAASAYVPAPVFGRETLHTGSVVKIKIPAGATDGAYPSGDEMIPFLKFCRSIRGGVVNFFVHTTDSALRGMTIRASASLRMKTFEDGRKFLYVDLIPVDSNTPITHVLNVMSSGDRSCDIRDHLVFTTPAPLFGVITFTLPPVRDVVLPAEPDTPKKSATGDFQLDRLLDAGWQIDGERSGKVFLSKMKNGHATTMTHHRRK